MEMNEADMGKICSKLIDLGDPRIKEITVVHAGIAGGLALIPIPFASTPLVLGNLYTMYGRINSALGIKFSENFLKSIGGMLASNLAGFAAGTVACQFIKFIPLLGSIGGAVAEGAINFAMTKVQGALYCEWLKEMVEKKAINENGHVDETVGKTVMEDICKDKERIKDMVEKEKQNAKNVDFNKYKKDAQRLADENKQ